jgi:hypothetical protein
MSTPKYMKETKTESAQISVLLAGIPISDLRRKAEAEKNELLASALWVAIHALGSIAFSKASDRKLSKQYAINEARRYRELKRKPVK